MSQGPAIPVPFGCSDVCVPSGTSSTPGPQGPQGDAGANGTNGVNAYSVATGGEAMPAEGATQSIAVNETAWMAPGAVLYVQGWGWMQVDSVTDGTNVVLLNLEDSVAGEYEGNSIQGTTLPASAIVEPSGPQGPAGVVDGSLYLTKAGNLVDIASPVTARANLGLGSAALYTVGIGNGQIPFVDDVTSLNADESVWSTGAGLIGYDIAATRTKLGLGSAALKDAAAGDGDVPFIDDVAGLNSGECVFVTALGGLEGLTPSEARTALGISSGNTFDMLLFRQVNVTGVFAQFLNPVTDWRTVPINTEVVDTGNHGSITGNDISLDAGTYRYEYAVIASNVDAFQARIYNNTASAVVGDSYSNLSDTNGGVNVLAFGEGRFTLAVASVIKLQGIAQTTGTFGTVYGPFLTDQIGGWIQLFKE